MASAPQSPRPRGEERTRSRTSTIEPRRVPTPRDLRAAVKLLGEDSPTVRRELRRAFGAHPKLAGSLLRRRTTHDDPKVRAHARALILHLERSEVVRRLLRHISKPQIDFERALFLLGRFENPSLDARPYRRALDGFAREFARRSAGLTGELERGRVLAKYLGEKVGFRGVHDGLFPPSDVHLHRAIETRRGLPLTLTAVHLCVARRAGLRVGVVPLPGHVMLRIYGRKQNLIIDPYHGGEARSQATLMHYLAKNGLTFKSIWFRDALDKDLLIRQVHNLARSLEMHERRAEVRLLRPILAAVKP